MFLIEGVCKELSIRVPCYISLSGKSQLTYHWEIDGKRERKRVNLAENPAKERGRERQKEWGKSDRYKEWERVQQPRVNKTWAEISQVFMVINNSFVFLSCYTAYLANRSATRVYFTFYSETSRDPTSQDLFGWPSRLLVCWCACETLSKGFAFLTIPVHRCKGYFFWGGGGSNCQCFRWRQKKFKAILLFLAKPCKIIWNLKSRKCYNNHFGKLGRGFQWLHCHGWSQKSKCAYSLHVANS